jgi:hypothetical protein
MKGYKLEKEKYEADKKLEMRITKSTTWVVCITNISSKECICIARTSISTLTVNTLPALHSCNQQQPSLIPLSRVS